MSLRLAIVGVGRMGSIHARTLAPSSTIDVVAVVDPAEQGKALADELSVPHFSHSSALYAGDRPDAVLIASPTPTHPAVVEEALLEGVHVLCEKPLSLDTDIGRHLTDLARRRGLILQVGFWRRFSPPWASAKRLIDDGAIGSPLMLRLSQWDAAPPPPAFCDPAVSGGLAIDCGVHEYDLAEWLTGRRVVHVSAWNLPIVDEHVGAAGDVDNMVAVLELEGGAVANVDLSRNAGYDDDVRTEILGEHGAIFIDLLPTGRSRVATDAGVHVVPDSQVEDALAAGLIAQVDACAAAVAGEEVEIPGGEDSNRAVTIGRAVQRAAVTGETQTVVV